MKILTAITMSAVLAGSAMAAPASPGALLPGKPAGVQSAQLGSLTFLEVGIAALAIGLAAAAATSNAGGNGGVVAGGTGIAGTSTTP